jgi:hypothetical protein
MNMVQRLPKWLLEETSAEIFMARGKPVCVRLFKGVGYGRYSFHGFGDSIAAAAKEALGSRDHVKADSASTHVAKPNNKKKS